MSCLYTYISICHDFIIWFNGRQIMKTNPVTPETHPAVPHLPIVLVVISCSHFCQEGQFYRNSVGTSTWICAKDSELRELLAWKHTTHDAWNYTSSPIHRRSTNVWSFAKLKTLQNKHWWGFCYIHEEMTQTSIHHGLFITGFFGQVAERGGHVVWFDPITIKVHKDLASCRRHHNLQEKRLLFF